MLANHRWLQPLIQAGLVRKITGERPLWNHTLYSPQGRAVNPPQIARSVIDETGRARVNMVPDPSRVRPKFPDDEEERRDMRAESRLSSELEDGSEPDSSEEGSASSSELDSDEGTESELQGDEDKDDGGGEVVAEEEEEEEEEDEEDGDEGGASEPDPSAGTDAEAETEPRPKYKSWKKKYRKMQLQFRSLVRENEQLFREDDEAMETIRRLQEENDQLRELLLDVNESDRLPARLRIDLGTPTNEPEPLLGSPVLEPSRPAFPVPSGEESENRPARVTGRTEEGGGEPAARRPITRAECDPTRPVPFGALLNVHHTRSMSGASPQLAEDLAHPAPLTFLSPAAEEEYLARIDKMLEDNPRANPFRSSSTTRAAATLNERDRERDLQMRNPMSAYNWLRRNQPQVFLQDHEGTPEKTGVKSSRGAGKRASAAAAKNLAEATQAGELLIDDGASSTKGPDSSPTMTTKAGVKRKRDEDGGYRPKGGSSTRPSRRKQRDSEAGAKKARKSAATVAATTDP